MKCPLCHGYMKADDQGDIVLLKCHACNTTTAVKPEKFWAYIHELEFTALVDNSNIGEEATKELEILGV